MSSSSSLNSCSSSPDFEIEESFASTIYPPFLHATDELKRIIPSDCDEAMAHVLSSLMVGNINEHVTAFLSHYTVYKNFLESEEQPWFLRACVACSAVTVELFYRHDLPEDILLPVLKLLYIFCRIGKCFEYIDNETTYRRIQDISAHYTSNPRVMTAVMLALGNITFQLKVDSLDKIIDMGFVDLAMNTVRNHITSAEVVEPCLWLMSNIFYCEKDTYPPEAITVIIEAIRAHPTNVGLVCEGCYGLYNLSCSRQKRYHRHMYELHLPDLICKLIPRMRTTQFFVPAMDLLLRMCDFPEGTSAVLRNLDAVVSVRKPGYEEHEFGIKSSFIPHEDELEKALGRCITHALHLSLREGGAGRDVLPGRFYVRRLASSATSLKVLAASKILKTHSAELHKLGHYIPASLISQMKTFQPCTHCGTPYHEVDGMVFIEIPTLRATAPDEFLDRKTFKYHFLCSRTCEKKVVQSMETLSEAERLLSPLQGTA